MDFSQTPQVEYAYTMEGLGKTWFETGDENRITFRNLEPGEYTFKVKAKMRNQPWGNKFTSLQIIIAPLSGSPGMQNYFMLYSLSLYYLASYASINAN